MMTLTIGSWIVFDEPILAKGFVMILACSKVSIIDYVLDAGINEYIVMAIVNIH